MSDDWGGYWTEAKLDVLRKYLAAFTRASKKSGTTVYLDLFAGALRNTRPDTKAEYAGSTALALRTVPAFTKLVFWELEGPAAKLRADLAAEFPADSRYLVVAGDCNTYLDEGLRFVSGVRWAPTFVFIDPRGLDVAWATLERLAKWRQDRKGRKTELWILLPEPALSRVLGLKGVRGQTSADLLTRLYGTDDWIAIHQRRTLGEFNPEQTRAEFVNLLRWRLERVLGYKKTHAMQLGNVSNQPMYTMVFATDVDVGGDIMQDIYGHAMVHEIPALRARAVSIRQRKREYEKKGVLSLWAPGEEPVPPIPPSCYEYIETWDPPGRLEAPVQLDDEPPEDA